MLGRIHKFVFKGVICKWLIDIDLGAQIKLLLPGNAVILIIGSYYLLVVNKWKKFRFSTAGISEKPLFWLKVLTLTKFSVINVYGQWLILCNFLVVHSLILIRVKYYGCTILLVLALNLLLNRNLN